MAPRHEPQHCHMDMRRAFKGHTGQQRDGGETELSSFPQRPRETSWLSLQALIEKVRQPLSYISHHFILITCICSLTYWVLITYLSHVLTCLILIPTVGHVRFLIPLYQWGNRGRESFPRSALGHMAGKGQKSRTCSWPRITPPLVTRFSETLSS